MRIGVAWEPGPSAAYYRASDPLREMEVLGHTVIWPETAEGIPDPGRLWGCDVVHVYRRYDPTTLNVMAELSRAGTAITWDNDDDLAAIPEESPRYAATGGDRGERVFRETVAAARLANVVTVPMESMATLYRDAGVARVVVLPNRVHPSEPGKRPRRDGLTIGWIAGMEHLADAARLDIGPILARLQEAHPQVRVECVGLDLQLPTRYGHQSFVPFQELVHEIRGYDIGIAPLSDIPFNRTRSDIKVKEYAALGVPWLASAAPPYAGLGEAQGGRLVEDGDWFAALEALIVDDRDRRRLAKAGRSWAATQTIRRAALDWEAMLESAVAAGPRQRSVDASGARGAAG